jgi:hypothetical protein
VTVRASLVDDLATSPALLPSMLSGGATGRDGARTRLVLWRRAVAR